MTASTLALTLLILSLFTVLSHSTRNTSPLSSSPTTSTSSVSQSLITTVPATSTLTVSQSLITTVPTSSTSAVSQSLITIVPESSTSSVSQSLFTTVPATSTSAVSQSLFTTVPASSTPSVSQSLTTLADSECPSYSLDAGAAATIASSSRSDAEDTNPPDFRLQGETSSSFPTRDVHDDGLIFDDYGFYRIKADGVWTYQAVGANYASSSQSANQPYFRLQGEASSSSPPRNLLEYTPFLATTGEFSRSVDDIDSLPPSDLCGHVYPDYPSPKASRSISFYRRYKKLYKKPSVAKDENPRDKDPGEDFDDN